MLRGAVLAVGIAILVGGAVVSYYELFPGIVLLIVGGLLTLGTMFERVIYKRLQSQRPRAGWVETRERFVDPNSGKMVEVFYNPATGEREYVERSTH